MIYELPDIININLFKKVHTISYELDVFLKDYLSGYFNH